MKSLLVCAMFLLSLGAYAQAGSDQRAFVTLPAGAYRQLFRSATEPKLIPVQAFRMDVCPVTNADFVEFVRANPQWRRSRVKRLFADEGYLQHWLGDLELGSDPDIGRQPVVFVSWFAAKAFCAWAGGRLPGTAEWEYAAAAGFTTGDGAREPEFARAISTWYSAPAPPKLPIVGLGRPNHFGVRDLHGLIWEWTSDFNSALVTGDARGDTGLERQFFCGAGSLDAADRTNFPAFLRFGFRSSLKAGYTVHNLGFRCAWDL